MFGKAASVSAKKYRDFKDSPEDYDAFQLAGGNPEKGVDCLRKSLDLSVLRLARVLINANGYYSWKPEEVSNSADFKSPILCCRFPSYDVKAADLRVAMIQLGISSHIYALSRPNGSQVTHVKIKKNDLPALKKAVENFVC